MSIGRVLGRRPSFLLVSLKRSAIRVAVGIIVPERVDNSSYAGSGHRRNVPAMETAVVASNQASQVSVLWDRDLLVRGITRAQDVVMSARRPDVHE
jgi:hypothetical protein